MTLAEAMRRQYSSAKLFWRCYLTLELLRLAIGVYALALTHPLLVVGAIAAIAPVASFFFKRTADAAYSIAERMRRLHYLEDGLGRAPSRADLLELHADKTGLPNFDPAPSGAYYSSHLPAGPQRLAHIAEEAAFHTRGYANATATVMSLVAGLGGIATCTLVWFGAQSLEELDQVQLLVRASMVVLTFFAAGSFVSLASSFQGLGKAAQRAFERLDRLSLDASTRAEDVLVVLSSYDGALARTPPIPSIVYWMLRGRLNRAWAEHGCG